MPIRLLTGREVEAEPYRVWDAYINLLAMEHYDDLRLEQRAAHLVFWYESEVQNGGHFQYFENRGTDHLLESIEALGTLGALCQQMVLREAGQAWLSRVRPRQMTVGQFVNAALEGEFTTLDRRFGQCSPDLQTHLANYLQVHQSAFVIIR